MGKGWINIRPTNNQTMFLLGLIVFLGLFLRLIAINQSLWLDEAIGALAVRDMSFFQLLQDFPKADNHPPFYYLVLDLWTSFFGYSEMAIRFPSIILGTLTIAVTYLISKRLSGKRFFVFFSSFLLATSPLHIYYSQEARMYAQAAFLVALAVYSYIRFRDGVIWWVLYSISLLALMFTDYVPIFIIPVFFLHAVFARNDKKWWVGFLATYIPLATAYFFWLPTFLHQSSRGRWLLSTLPAWKSVAGGASIKQAVTLWNKFVWGRISFFNKHLYFGLVFLFSIPFAAALAKALKDKSKIVLIWLWLLVPLVLGFVASFSTPFFIYFRFIYVLPAFYILVSWGTSSINSKKTRNILAVLLIAINISGWLVYVLDAKQHREQWRDAVIFVENKIKQNEIVAFEFPEPFAPYMWYAPQSLLKKSTGLTSSIFAGADPTYQKTVETIRDVDGVYYFEYLADLSDPDRIVENAFTDSGFSIKSINGDFVGIGKITYYTKDE